MTSHIFLLAESVPWKSLNWFYESIDAEDSSTVLVLDQVTDIHNAGAIVRTAAFYGVKYILTNNSNTFGLNSGFFRAASGGAEHVSIIKCSNLSRVLTKLKEKSFMTYGFLMDGEEVNSGDDFPAKRCLVLGSEDHGISNAVSRILEKKIRLSPYGPISTLNVSVATAVVLEKFAH